jgi:hypothetical protein
MRSTSTLSLLATLLVSIATTACTRSASTEDPTAAQTSTALMTDASGPVCGVGRATYDIGSAAIAGVICKDANTCTICTQAVDPSGTPVQWAVHDTAHCTCAGPRSVPVRPASIQP